jgi:outer membrane receptor protein involved in Fe transport
MFGGFLEPTIGLRYFSDNRGGTSTTNTTQSLTFLNPPPPPIMTYTPGVPEAATGNFNSLDPRFNVAAHWSNNWLTYINIAKGFRSGSFNSTEEEAIAAGYGVSAGRVMPDTIWSYEIGSKATLDDGKLSLEGALYYSRWDNIQLLVTDPITFISFEVNGGSAVAEGVEYDVTYRPISGLSLQASGNFNDSTLRTISHNLASLTFIRAGDPLNYVPKVQFNGSGTYVWDLGWGSGLKGYLYGAVNYHSSLADTTTSGILRGDPITVVNLRGGVQTDRWGAYLFANNLSDENAAVTRNSDGTAVRLEPRVVGVNLRYAFN